MVTGGAGFIGSELVRQLAAAGFGVLVVDNLVNGRREHVASLGDQVRLEVADVRDRARLPSLMRGVDIVFHLACLGVRHSIHSPRENHDVNATATLDLLTAARDAGVGRFVYVSSSEVYGTARRAPMSEEHPTFPHTVYGGSKLAGESYARAFHDTHAYPTVIVRPFNAYGPRSHHEGDSGEVIPRFLLRCLAGQPLVVFGDGRQTRDFTFVSDTARGIMAAGLADEAIGQTVNLGSGRETSIVDLARSVADVVGRRDVHIVHDRPRPGDILRLCADISRARQLLNFEPGIALPQGLAQLRDWYLQLGVPPETLLERETLHNWEMGRRESSSVTPEL
jgi:UDP-glucose 4-epimerase